MKKTLQLKTLILIFFTCFILLFSAATTILSVRKNMDVAMSISSALWELREKAGLIKFETLFRSGINIGRDIFGTMANTLILAYIGTSLSVVILLGVYSNSLLDLLNSEMIIAEILKALAGSFGILFAMPLTAFFCAVFYLRQKPVTRSPDGL